MNFDQTRSFAATDTRETSLFSDMLYDPEESYLCDNLDLGDETQECDKVFDSLD